MNNACPSRPHRPERPEPLPDLTPQELREVIHAARLAKAGRAWQTVLFGRGGRLEVVPVQKV